MEGERGKEREIEDKRKHQEKVIGEAREEECNVPCGYFLLFFFLRRLI